MKTEKEIRACIKVCQGNIGMAKLRIKLAYQEIEQQEHFIEMLEWTLQPSVLDRKESK